MFQKLWPFNSSSQPNGPIQANEHQDHGVSTKVKPIHASFKKGIPLNMKIVIRGDIRTGKTSLFHRLQGLPFQDERHYKTTSQIQVANIPWQYPHTKDIIKVEIWDVVDNGLQAVELKSSSSTNNSTTLKIDNNAPTSPVKPKPSISSSELAPYAAFSLDASTIDVYRNTDGVIILYDVSKPWTFDYVSKALIDVPVNMPVLILSNFSDDSHPRPVIASERIRALMEEHNGARRKHPCAPANLIRHLDTSMKTGLGLKEIHDSFGIPFLNVLRETHRKQFEQKTLEINELLGVLDSYDKKRPVKQQNQQSVQHVPSKETASSKRNLSIQTTGQTIHPIPQSTSPTSPARKTRNDYTNVDILSPTPVSAQTPAVLFDFNVGKLEEDFFQNSTLDSAPDPSDKGESLQDSEQQLLENNEVDIGGNPMVARDEDIDGESSDEEAKALSLPALAPVWTPGQVEKELVSRHMVKGSEVRDDDNDDSDVDVGLSKSDSNDAELGAGNNSDSSSQGDTPPLNNLLQQDSDIESQPDFAIASAMYYEHGSSIFGQDERQLSSAMSPTSRSHYEEIVDDEGDNPWKSAGDLTNGGGRYNDGGIVYKPHHDDRGRQSTDKDEDLPEIHESLHSGMENSAIRNKGKTIEINTESSSPTIVAGDNDTAEPSSTLTISMESSGGDVEETEDGEEVGDEEDSSPVVSTLQEKKTTKKPKKKTKKRR
ncbi:hypothetical protein BGZ46_001485 [Entomortierella lignicola]|nr:hypothetical protein BGZ46_001485 [Entomortierella lignicola]